MEVTLKIKNQEEWRFVKELLDKLQIEVLRESISSKNQEEAFAALERIAQRGTYAQTITDPLTWQREIRKNRKLPFRDE